MRAAASFLALHALILATSALEISWTFYQPDGDGGRDLLAGSELQAALGTPVVEYGTDVIFSWSQDGFPHSLFEVPSSQAFEACDLTTATQLAPASASGSQTLSMAQPGVRYFIDGYATNCDSGLKIQIETLDMGATTPPSIVVTTPPNTVVDQPSSTDAPVVTWHNGQSQPDVHIQANGFVRFFWSDEVAPGSFIRHRLLQVSKEDYANCNENANGTDYTNEVATSQDNILIDGLDVGVHYFLDPMPAACDAGGLRVRVFVSPADSVYYVTVWPNDEAVVSTDPVFISLTGNDAQSRVWTSPLEQLNQQADGNGELETVQLSSTESGFFAVQMMDVGMISSVTLVRMDASAAYTAAAVRIQPSDLSEQSKMFRCSLERTSVDNVEPLRQTCIITQEEEIEYAPTNLTRPLQTDCSCFREFLLEANSGRVLTCTSDGCFATADDGKAGWTEITSIVHLLGTTADGRVVAENAANETVVSRDGGVSWIYPYEGVPDMVVDVIRFDIDIDNLTESPLDTDVHMSGSGVEWGLSSQGIHHNVNGAWRLSAMWSCSCPGACGLECNQESFY